jgi:hypothetical protein
MLKSKEELQSKYGIKEKSDWLNLKEGSNKIRIVSNFVDYGVHSVKYEGKYKSVVCVGKENGCFYCAEKLPVKIQFLGWVIDRKDGEVKLLKIGWTIAEKLRNLKESEDYGFKDLPDYDIDIIRTGEGLDTEYDVIPARKSTELTEEEKEKVLKNIKDPQEIIDKMKEKVMATIQPKELSSLTEDDSKIVDEIF